MALGTGVAEVTHQVFSQSLQAGQSPEQPRILLVQWVPVPRAPQRVNTLEGLQPTPHSNDPTATKK